MKKILVLVTMMTVFLSASAQIKICAYYDGYWGEWKNAYDFSLYGGINTVDESSPYLKIYGNYSGFSTYASTDHPSVYMFKFQISNYLAPDKKAKKQHLKSNEWYVYSGTVEYFVKDEHETIKDILAKDSYFGRIPVTQSTWPGARKRIAKATIKIAPYKDHPRVYNIWFEGVAVGIDLNTVYFNQKNEK